MTHPTYMTSSPAESSTVEPSRKDIAIAIGMIVLVVGVLAGVGYALFSLPNTEHQATDTAVVVEDHTYLADNGIGGAAAVNGVIGIVDLRNKDLYSFAPGCQYWHVNSTLTIQLTWYDDVWYEYGAPHSEASASFFVTSNIPSGCHWR